MSEQNLFGREEDILFLVMNSDSEEEIESESEESEDEAVQVETPDDQPSSTNIQPSTSQEQNDLSSVWKTGDFTPKLHNFDASTSGTKISFAGEPTEIDIFEHFLSREIMTHICEQTNKYFRDIKASKEVAPHSRLNKWTDVTVERMYLFFAMIMMMARSKKINLSEYWSTQAIHHIPIFGQCMSKDRFLLILSMLHFCDNDEADKSDRLYKIRTLIDYARNAFKNSLTPFENICIDESLVLWKGRLCIRQYIPSKRSRFGIKLFVMVCVETGYIIDFIIYAGANTEIQDVHEVGTTGAVVTTLMKDFINKGHNLWVDNWYTSPKLFSLLHQNKTNACGTVKSNRKGMPKFPNIAKGEAVSMHNGNLLALKWKDKRDVHMLSTMHTGSMAETGKINFKTGQPIIKPKCVLDYNVNMGAVDKTDMLIGSVECIRRTTKWYKKLAFHIIDMMLLNSYTTFLTTTSKRPTFPQFHDTIITKLLEKYREPTNSRVGRPPTSNPLRLTERHFPSDIPGTSGSKKPYYKNCHVCSQTSRRPRQRKATRFWCKECRIPLCCSPCFQEYHTITNY